MEEMFAERFNFALKKRNITPAQLSKIIHVDEGSISNYRSGRYEPKQKRIEQIAKVLDVSVAWIMGADVPMENMGLTAHEAEVIKAYRAKPELQDGIDMLLGISKKELVHNTS